MLHKKLLNKKRETRSHIGNGFTLIETLLVLFISFSAMILKFNEIKQQQELNSAYVSGEQIKTIAKAVDSYITLKYGQLSTLSSSTGQPNDLGYRVCSGNICTIKTQTLIDNGLLPIFNGKNIYGSTYSIQLKRSGVAPNYVINGMVITDQPLTVNGKVRYDLLGEAMKKAGAESGMSRNANLVSGYVGIWNEKSADYSIINKAGQLACRVGFDSGMYTVYLRRDGTLPMTGDLNLDSHNINNVNNLTALGSVNAGSIKATGNIEGGTINAIADIRAGGEISASNGYGDLITIGGDTWANDYEIRLNQPKMLSIFSPKATDYTTVLNMGRGNARFSQRLGLMGTDPNVLPTGWGGGLTTWDVYANGTVGLGSGGGLAAYINSSGNVFASNNITGGSVTANGRLTAGEFIQLNGVAGLGGGCSPNGLLGRDAVGSLLSCQNGKWAAGTGNVGVLRAHTANGGFVASSNGYLAARSYNNRWLGINVNGNLVCEMAARDKYGQGKTSCSAIIRKGDSYSISGAEAAYWRDL